MNSLGKYFNAYENRKYPHTLGPFDEDGVPLFHTSKLNLGNEITYHPIVIIQYGLACYNLYLEEGCDERKKDVITCAQWLINNLEKDNNLFRWPYQFDLKFPKLKAPWYSGMCQGQALSLLVRAYQITAEENFIKPIPGVVDTLFTKIEDGGCSTLGQDGQIFIQEIANRNHDSFILNGALYALIGIMEAVLFVSLEQKKIDNLITSMSTLLPKYDTGYWSKYSLGIRFNLADEYYHQVHIQQLNLLHKMTNNEVFRKVSEQFQSYGKKGNVISKFMRFLYLNINRIFRVLNLERLLFKKVEFG